jgi:hypothetical protein
MERAANTPMLRELYWPNPRKGSRAPPARPAKIKLSVTSFPLKSRPTQSSKVLIESARSIDVY